MIPREAELVRNTSFPRKLFVDEHGFIRDGWETAGVVLGLVLVAMVVLGFIVGGFMWIDAASCSSRWRAAGVEASWGPLQGCIVKTEYGWLPEHIIRDVKVH